MRQKRRALVLTMATWPFTVNGQQAKQNYRIGYLSGGPGLSRFSEVFRERLRELGFAEGKNLTILWRFSAGRPDRAAELAMELVRLNVDCIATNGVSYVRAAKQATQSIPIVMINMDADPVELGFVASLARPGGNITGFIGIAPELAGKRLELLKEVVPSAKRLGMLLGAPVGDAQKAHYRGTENAARRLGMEIRLFVLQTPEDLEGLFTRTADWRPDILSVFSGTWFSTHRTKIIDWVGRMKLPAIYSSQEAVDSGGLMSYSDDPLRRTRDAAAYVAKILSGTRPSDLPVQQPTKFELVINLKAAKALGVTFPQTVMLRADRVIE
jgi:putative ABC transport system substrate-binding protein